MRNSLLPLAILIFWALVFGGFVVVSGGGLPTVEQVSSANASVTEAADSQLGVLSAVVFTLFVATIVMGGGLASLFLLLNREVTKADQQEVTPFEFSLKPEGNTIGAIIQNNTWLVVGTIAMLLIAILVGLVLFTGALA